MSKNPTSSSSHHRLVYPSSAHRAEHVAQDAQVIKVPNSDLPADVPVLDNVTNPPSRTVVVEDGSTTESDSGSSHYSDFTQAQREPAAENRIWRLPIEVFAEDRAKQGMVSFEWEWLILTSRGVDAAAANGVSDPAAKERDAASG